MPIWDGSSSDPSAWDNYRYAIQGYCAEKGLPALLRIKYDNSVKSEDEETSDDELQGWLMGILLRTTEDVAGMVVRPFAEEGNGVGAWRALISRYGNDSLELRQANQIEYTQKVYEMKCEDRCTLLDNMHVLEHLFVELDKLECELPDSYKRNTLLLQIRTVAPEIYAAVVSNTEMGYISTLLEVKKLAALNSVVDQPGGGGTMPTEAFYSKTAKKGKRWAPWQNQCFWCLEMGHRVADCPSRKKGTKAKQRPDGTSFKPKGGHNGGGSGDNSPPSQSFQSFCFVTEAKGADGGWLVDSGCNRHMTPNREDLTNLQPSNIECTFGNNEKLKAEGTGDVTVEGYTNKGEKVKIILNNVLYVPGLPQRMLSTGQLRKVGGEYIESEIRGSKLIMPNQQTVLPLDKRRDYLWLAVKVLKEDDHVSSAAVYAPGSRETALASMVDWHEALGHFHPASILYLEQRGLISISGEKTLDDFNCRICKEAKSTVPHYQRGT